MEMAAQLASSENCVSAGLLSGLVPAGLLHRRLGSATELKFQGVETGLILPHNVVEKNCQSLCREGAEHDPVRELCRYLLREWVVLTIEPGCEYHPDSAIHVGITRPCKITYKLPYPRG